MTTTTTTFDRLQSPRIGSESGRPASSVGDGQDSTNRRVYHADHVTDWYQSTGLQRAETMALLKYQTAFAARDVLDLGVGTGRTTCFLAPLSGTYLGVDYSPPMIEHLHAAMPDIDVQVADIRNLSTITDQSFDFVLASNSVIDAVSHLDRLRALREAHRVLRPGGVLMFSSHNRSLRTLLDGPRLERSRNPISQAILLVHYLRSLVNHASVGHLRRFERDYAILDDAGHDHALLHYYISRDAQRNQLAQVAFRLLDVFSESGLVLPASLDDDRSASLLYVARRSD